jgi:hypothetical protein
MPIHLNAEQSAAQYDKFLSPKDSKYGVFEATLFVKRLWHLIIHQEWLDDATLVKKFKAQLGESKPVDITTNYIFDQFLLRVNPAKRSALDSLKPLRFSQDLWYVAREGKALTDDEIKKIKSENYPILDNKSRVVLDYHLQNLKKNNNSENRVALKNWLISVEAPGFKKEVESMLDSIYRGRSSPEELKIQTRIIRSFLDTRGYEVGSRDDPGSSRMVFNAIIEMLKSDFSRPYVPLSGQNLKVQNGLLYLPQVFRGGKRGEDKWLAAVFLCEPPLTPLQKPHMVSYIFDGEHYISLNNMKNERKKLTAEELKNLMIKSNFDANSQVIALDNAFRPTPPNPSTWTVPYWERNNCFFVSALIELALHKYYMKI